MFRTAAVLRDRTVQLVVLAVAAACLAAVPARASAGADPPRHWAGYRIPRTGDASGGWIGGYRQDRTRLFVTTPRKRPNRRGFESVRPVGDLHAGRGASRAETARAAWILSKYGGYRDRVQAAAVDATVQHLLAGKRWRIAGSSGSRRIRQTPDPAAVRRFARIMLRGSRRSAGAYRAAVTAAPAELGGTLEVAVVVTDGHGEPAPGLPVTLGAAGAVPVEAVTGDDGRAVGRFAATQRGWQDVGASVRNVPEHRLLLHAPVRRRQASAAEGGVKRTLVVSTRAAVRGPQTVALAASPATVPLGSPTRVVATVAGDGTPRGVTGTLHGPYAAAAAAECSGAAAATVASTVGADGEQALPQVTPVTGGYYVWRVAVDGTPTSLPVAACGAPTKVLGRTATSVTGPAGATVDSNVTATVSVSGLPFPARVDLTITLFGPYASPAARSADACSGPVAHTETVRRFGNGSLTSGPVYLEAAGLYAWQSQAAVGELWQGSRSPCLASGSLMGVS